MGRKLAVLICLLAVCFFSFSAFIFLTHYAYMGIMMTPREMFFALYSPGKWFSHVVLTHIGGMSLILMNLGILAFVILYARWIYQSAYNLDKKWIRKDTASYSAIHRTLQFLVFFGCAWLLIRWVSECFPLHDYEQARQYQEYFDIIRNTPL